MKKKYKYGTKHKTNSFMLRGIRSRSFMHLTLNTELAFIFNVLILNEHQTKSWRAVLSIYTKTAIKRRAKKPVESGDVSNL